MMTNVRRESEKNETRNFPVNCKYASFSCYVTLEVGTCVKVATAATAVTAGTASIAPHVLPLQLFFHSPYDVADTSAFTRELCTLLNRNVGMSVVASVGGVGVRELAVDRRRCLYTEEHTNAHTQVAVAVHRVQGLASILITLLPSIGHL